MCLRFWTALQANQAVCRAVLLRVRYLTCSKLLSRFSTFHQARLDLLIAHTDADQHADLALSDLDPQKGVMSQTDQTPFLAFLHVRTMLHSECRPLIF